jgi:plasmid stabilization system protein ParE
VADVFFHPEAQAEYDAAIAWYQARSPQSSQRFETEVERILARIESAPDMFPKYDALHRFAVLRRFPYSIIYQAQAPRIYVVAVTHGSRLPGYWRGRT